MRRIVTVALCLAFTAALPLAMISEDSVAAATDGTRSEEVNVLLLVCNSLGSNYNLIRDVMELYGWHLTTVGVTSSVSPCAYGGAVDVDLLVTEVTDLTSYDCLAIMPATAWGGNSHSQLLASPEAVALVADAAAEGLLVAAFCGGTRVLAAADVIDGVQVVGHPLYEQEYLDAGAIYIADDVPPLVDGNIMTSRRGQYYAYEIYETMGAAIDSLRAAAVR